MYTEQNKGFTIITNFGCNNKCTYCISKHHPILQNKLTNENNIDWNYLEQCIAETNSPKVNLSGGGDPFYNYQLHKDFYFKVFELCQKYNKLMDIHTRIIPNDKEIIKLFNKIALAIEFDDIKAIDNLHNKYNKIKDLVKVRVIQVVNSKLDIAKCKNFINTINNIGIKQVTFRQMFGNKKAYEHYKQLKNNFKSENGVLFLDDGEYHDYYFTTNNKLYHYFFGECQADREYWKKTYENIEQSCN